MRLNRKTFLKGVAATAAGLSAGRWTSIAGAAGRAPVTVKRRRPNILFIMMDQERSWRDLPPDLDLPRRRAFAETALSFVNFHGNVVACGPSRSVIYTGQHIQKTGVFDNPAVAPGRNDLDPQHTPTIGNILRDEGYHTAYIGKWHLHGFGPRERSDMVRALDPFGFREFHPATPEGDTDGEAWYGAKYDPALARTAAQWLGRRRGDDHEPWFLAVNLINPHDIRHFDATGRQGADIHPHFAAELAGLPDIPLYHEDLGFALPESFRQNRPRAVPAHDLFVRDAEYFFGAIPLDNEAAWARYQNYYFNCLRDVDRHIGTILDALDEAGLARDTIVIFTSDHGEMGGAHGLRGKGPFLYKENFRLPLLIRHPDLAAGVTDALACSLDLVPTILAMAGIARGGLPGHDLLGGAGRRDGILFMSNIVHCCSPAKKRHIEQTLYARDRGEDVPPLAFPDDFVDFSNRFFLRGIFDGRYKFGRYFAPGEHHRPDHWETLSARNDLELYDTAADPQEVANLAPDPGHRRLMMDLNARLNALLDREAGSDDGSFMSGDPSLWRTDF